jgi:hypothetical protein
MEKVERGREATLVTASVSSSELEMNYMKGIGDREKNQILRLFLIQYK